MLRKNAEKPRNWEFLTANHLNWPLELIPKLIAQSGKINRDNCCSVALSVQSFLKLPAVIVFHKITITYSKPLCRLVTTYLWFLRNMFLDECWSRWEKRKWITLKFGLPHKTWQMYRYGLFILITCYDTYFLKYLLYLGRNQRLIETQSCFTI